MTVDNAKLISLLTEIKALLAERADKVEQDDTYYHLGICVARSRAERQNSYDERASTPEGEVVMELVQREFDLRGIKGLYLFDNGVRASYEQRIKIIDGWIKQAELRQELERFEKAKVAFENDAAGFMCNALGANENQSNYDLIGERCMKTLLRYKPDNLKAGAAWWTSATWADTNQPKRLRIAILNLCIEDIKNEIAAS